MSSSIGTLELTNVSVHVFLTAVMSCISTCVECAYANLYKHQDSMSIAPRMHQTVWDTYSHLLFMQPALLQRTPTDILMFCSRNLYTCNGQQIKPSHACTDIRTTSIATGWNDHIMVCNSHVSIANGWYYHILVKESPRFQLPPNKLYMLWTWIPYIFNGSRMELAFSGIKINTSSVATG